MLCPRCRRQVNRDARLCGSCGAALGGEAEPLEVVLPDGTRVPLTDTVTIGRAAGNAIRLDHPTVSRNHARIVVEPGVSVEDAGSSHGTFVDGRRVGGPTPIERDASLQLGDVELRIERRRAGDEAGRTIVVRVGASLVVPAVGRSELDSSTTSPSLRPRVRSGWALKRLGTAEGYERYVLRDLRQGVFMRMGEREASLFRLLDGSHSLSELVAEAELRDGQGGAVRLARLLADLGEHGMLEGVDSAGEQAQRGRLARLLRPRELVVAGVGDLVELLYRRGGFLLFTPAALTLFALVAVAGLAAFAAVLAARLGAPFVVASSVGLGGLVFLAGRFLVVAVHELAHGLTAASFGRRVPRAGLKLVAVFPFAFVDTSEAWFEPRRRRIAISAAGPAADLVTGGTFALLALATEPGGLRDVWFQVAFAGYVGAFFNLNPLLDRDGYQMLVDGLRQPGLRRRSREYLARRLAGGQADRDAPRALQLYAGAALAWSTLGAGFAVLISSWYYRNLLSVAPRAIVWPVLALLYLAILVPVLVVIWRPLRERWRRGETGAPGAVA